MDILLNIGIVSALAFALQKYITLSKVHGDSMFPTLVDGQIVIVLKTTPQEGDIVVFKHKDKHYIKRIANKNEEGYYVLGDNRNNSEDSRHFGRIQNVTGKVWTSA